MERNSEYSSTTTSTLQVYTQIPLVLDTTSTSTRTVIQAFTPSTVPGGLQRTYQMAQARLPLWVYKFSYKRYTCTRINIKLSTIQSVQEFKIPVQVLGLARTLSLQFICTQTCFCTAYRTRIGPALDIYQELFTGRCFASCLIVKLLPGSTIPGLVQRYNLQTYLDGETFTGHQILVFEVRHHVNT